jgi:hypothetical protein
LKNNMLPRFLNRGSESDLFILHVEAFKGLDTWVL